MLQTHLILNIERGCPQLQSCPDAGGARALRAHRAGDSAAPAARPVGSGAIGGS